MKKIFLCLTLLICLCSVFVPKLYAKNNANQNNTDQNTTILNLENAYAKMKSFKAQFNQELFHRESNTTQSRKGTILFQQPINIYWETEKPNAEVLIINDREIWNYLPEEEIAYRYHPDIMESSHAALSVITGQKKINDNFEIEILDDADATAEGLEAFLLYPLNPTPQIVEAQLWINPKTNEIKKATILDFYGNTNSIEFTQFTKNAKVKKTTFTFKTPEGVDVEDHYKEQ